MTIPKFMAPAQNVPKSCSNCRHRSTKSDFKRCTACRDQATAEQPYPLHDTDDIEEAAS